MATTQTAKVENARMNQELQTSKTDLAAANRQVDQLEGQVRSTKDRNNRAEEALVESDRRFRRLIEFSPDAMFIKRANRIVFANQRCLKLFGASSPEQVLGKTVFDFIHPDFHAIMTERLGLMYHLQRVGG
jgi:two-component system sporulation sensor kinase A